jgi:outer membrane protein TolC
MTVALGALTAMPLCAQTVYTLEQCRDMALSNNVKSRNADNSLKAARQGRASAFTNYFPTISATGMGYDANKGLLQMDMGPEMSMSLLKDGVLGGVTLTQPIFAGGQIVNGNRLAKVGVNVSEIQKEESANEVRLTVEQYYWQVVTIKEKLNTLNAVEKQLQRINGDVELSVKAGLTTRNDLLQVRLKLNDVQSNRINLENTLTLCNMLLAQYIGLDNADIDVVSEVTMDSVPPFPQELYTDHGSALRQTTGYRLLDNNVRAEQLKKKIEVGKNLPTVGAGVGYMYDNLMDKDHAFALGFVSVSVPISGWWGGSHDVKKQSLMVKNAENTFSDASELLVISMQKAWNDLQDAYKQMGIAANSIEQSAENLRLNEDYYRAGTTTMSDLLDAETLYQQSRDKYVDAFSSFRIKEVEYLQATGR